MEHVPSTAQPLDLREYLTILARRKLSIALIALVTLGSALAFSFQQTPIYSATAGVLVKPPVTSPTTSNIPATTLISMDTEKRIANSTSVAQLAAPRIHAGVQHLLDNLDVSVGTNELVLEITYSDPDPHVAQAGAIAVANAYLKYKTGKAVEAQARLRDVLAAQIEKAQKQLQAALAAQEKAEPGSPEATTAAAAVQALETQKAGLEAQYGTLSASAIDPGDVIEEPELPTEPSSPRILVNAALAAFVGLALGVGLAFLRERLDDRLRGREALEEAAGAPVLAVVPKVPGWRKRSRAELPAAKAPKGAVAEAYRTIRTNLLFMAKDGELKALALTSPAAGEGKTTTTANLAVSLAQAGKRVIVVSADLRKPRLHRFFGLPNDVGLSTVLARQSGMRETIQRPLIENLRVMASGPVPSNPGELLTSNDMDALLEQLKGVADFVIVDTPPVLAVSDVLTLAPRMDGVLIVADAQSSHRGAIAHLRDQLEQVGGNVIGAVLNNFDPSSAKYYPAYYRYTYTYRYRDEDGRDRRERRGREQADGTLEDIWQTDEIWVGEERPVRLEPEAEPTVPEIAGGANGNGNGPAEVGSEQRRTIGDSWSRP